MFNGIIETTGTITSLQKTKGGGARLRIDAGKLASRLRKGDSVSVDGVCLTAVKKTTRQLTFDVSAETLRRTNLAHQSAGDRVNLELSARVGDGISGHIVQGHVEGLARVKTWIRKGDDVRLVLELPVDLAEFCVEKGSITANGVSLTIASLRRRRIEIALIPYTLQVTNLPDLEAGNLVNIETDVIGRYVVSALKKEYHKTKRKVT